MADFKTHVSFSSILGVGYAASGVIAGFSPSTALVAGGLCGVSGMLPDIDSDSGVPRREAMGFAAAIVPMLLVSRLQSFQLQHDQMVLVAALLYYLIRFVAARMIGRFSVHRGMFHSIPAALIFAGLAFLIAGGDDVFVRYYKSAAVFVGCMSHLVLDEIYSVDTRGVVPKFKKSFGTAVKLFGKDGWANFSTYAKLAVVGIAILGDQAVSQRIEQRNPELAGKIRNYQERFLGFANRDEEMLAPAGDPIGAPAVNPQVDPRTAPSQGYAAQAYNARDYAAQQSGAQQYSGRDRNARGYEQNRPAPPSYNQPAYDQRQYQQPVYSDPRRQGYAYDQQRSRQYDPRQYDAWQRSQQGSQRRPVQGQQGYAPNNRDTSNGFEANRPRKNYAPPSPGQSQPGYNRSGYDRSVPSYETARRGVAP